jgi:hypothetical protein
MALSFRRRTLDVAEAAALGRNMVFEIDYAHLAAAGATTSDTATLLTNLAARHELGKVAFNLVTAFDGTSTTNLAMEVGVDGDTDCFIASTELHNDATEIICGGPTLTAPTTSTVDETYATNESTVLTNLRTLANQIIDSAPKVLTISTRDLVAVFTATGANLTDLTSGVVCIFAKVTDLSKYRAP